MKKLTSWLTLFFATSALVLGLVNLYMQGAFVSIIDGIRPHCIQLRQNFPQSPEEVAELYNIDVERIEMFYSYKCNYPGDLAYWAYMVLDGPEATVDVPENGEVIVYAHADIPENALYQKGSMFSLGGANLYVFEGQASGTRMFVQATTTSEPGPFDSSPGGLWTHSCVLGEDTFTWTAKLPFEAVSEDLLLITSVTPSQSRDENQPIFTIQTAEGVAYYHVYVYVLGTSLKDTQLDVQEEYLDDTLANYPGGKEAFANALDSFDIDWEELAVLTHNGVSMLRFALNYTPCGPSFDA